MTTAVRGEQIAQAIGDVIETHLGERVMLPNYGIPDFVFSTMDAGFAARLQHYIETAIRDYVPLVKSVKATSEIEGEGRVTVKVQYVEVGQVNAPKNLVFPVWRPRDVEA